MQRSLLASLFILSLLPTISFAESQNNTDYFNRFSHDCEAAVIKDSRLANVIAKYPSFAKTSCTCTTENLRKSYSDSDILILQAAEQDSNKLSVDENSRYQALLKITYEASITCAKEFRAQNNF